MTGKTSVDWKRGPQPSAAGKVASPEALVGVIENLMNAVSVLHNISSGSYGLSRFLFLMLAILRVCVSRVDGDGLSRSSRRVCCLLRDALLFFRAEQSTMFAFYMFFANRTRAVLKFCDPFLLWRVFLSTPCRGYFYFPVMSNRVGVTYDVTVHRRLRYETPLNVRTLCFMNVCATTNHA